MDVGVYLDINADGILVPEGVESGREKDRVLN